MYNATSLALYSLRNVTLHQLALHLCSALQAPDPRQTCLDYHL